MKIETAKELQKLIKIMRAEGVDKIKVDGIEIELGLAPVKPTKAKQTQVSAGITEDTKIELPQELTEEQLLMWSVANIEEA